MPCDFIASACSLVSRIASRPPCTLGRRGFTRTSIISAKRQVSGGFSLDGWNATDVFGSLRMPRIVCALRPGPDSGAVTEELAEAHRDVGRYRLSFPQDVVKVLTRNSEQAGDLGLGAAG